MSPRPLNNDRLNYLVWRYLQEHGHAQTAARFQIDWGNNDPDGLPFSQHIKTHSLIYLIQKGLRYHELEVSISQPGGNSVQPFFGPEDTSAQPPNRNFRQEEPAVVRKHARDSLVNGISDDLTSLSSQAPAPKRPRRSNGQASSAANGGSSRGAKSGDAMDIDELPTKREATNANSPLGAAQAQGGGGGGGGDTEMELDPESKANVFHHDSHPQQQQKNGDAVTGADNNVNNAVSLLASTNSVGEGDAGIASGGASTGAPSAAAAAATTATSADASIPSFQSGAVAAGSEGSLLRHYQTQLEQRHLDQQLEGAVQAQAQAQLAGQAALIPTLKDGRSVGVQSDKVQTVTDLGPETAVLSVPGKNVTHARWSPRDPALLATAGDALCRLWTIPTTHLLARSGAATQNSNRSPTEGKKQSEANGHVNGVESNGVKVPALPALDLDPKNIVDLHDGNPNMLVTAMAWSHDGEMIAFARHPKDDTKAKGEISIYNKNGTFRDNLPGGVDWVTSLSWNTGSGSSRFLLLGVSHSGPSASTIMLWNANAGATIGSLKFDTAVMDAVWAEDSSFYVCGYNLIRKAKVAEKVTEKVTENGIEPLQLSLETGEPREWSRICYDSVTKTVAVASDATGILGLIDADEGFHTVEAHKSEITAMKYQPLANPSALAANDPRLLATGSADGSVKIWNTRQPATVKYELHLGKESQTLDISFTPDGYLLAAASWDTILFWNPETGGSPKAIWEGSKIGWLSNNATANGHHSSENGDTLMGDAEASEDDTLASLSWDADGGKVAFTSKDQIAIVSFRRQ